MQVPLTKEQIDLQVARENQAAAASEARQKKLEKFMSNAYASPPVKIYYDLALKSAQVRERPTSELLTEPGDYCVKNAAVALTQGGRTAVRRQVILNCPVCNQAQFLSRNEFDYAQPTPQWQRTLKTFFNTLLRRELFNIYSGNTLTVGGMITCQHNRLHTFTINRNKIQAVKPGNG